MNNKETHVFFFIFTNHMQYEQNLSLTRAVPENNLLVMG